MMVDGRGIAEALTKVRAHGFEHLRQNRGGGVIVEINAADAHFSILRWTLGR